MIGRRVTPLLRWYLDHDTEVPIDVYTAFRDEFIKELMANPEGVTLPARLGYIKIVGNKSPSEYKGLKVPKDRAMRERQGAEPTSERRKKGIIDYYHNFGTDGWVFKVEWFSRAFGKHEDTMERAFFNSEMYGWKSGDLIKKALCEKLRSGEWDHFHKKAFILSVRTKGKVGRPRNADRVTDMDDRQQTEVQDKTEENDD